jgi:NAD(P)-dependent dehydrogenase (short-subunit alcohol dehydrogenase family)
VEGRTVVVTGGAAGIGRAVVLCLADRKARVAILDLDAAKGEATAQEALARGAQQAVAIPCDVSSEESVVDAISRSRAHLGVPSGLFANAGVDRGGPLDALPLDTWRQVLDTNLTGVFLTCKHTIQLMLAEGTSGSIVCTSSPGAYVGFSSGGMGAYGASKAGISALVRSMAVDYAKFGIRVNAVVPGPTETALMWASVPESEQAAMRQTIQSEVPLGRLADPEEPARAAVWLFSDESSYVTGSHLVCDGGVLAKASISV